MSPSLRTPEPLLYAIAGVVVPKFVDDVISTLNTYAVPNVPVDVDGVVITFAVNSAPVNNPVV